MGPFIRATFRVLITLAGLLGTGLALREFTALPFTATTFTIAVGCAALFEAYRAQEKEPRP